jgi:hypothetical protein
VPLQRWQRTMSAVDRASRGASGATSGRVGWPWARAGRVQRRTAIADERWASHLSDMASHVVEAIHRLPAFGVVFRPFSLNGLSGHALGRIRTFDRLLSKLLYPTELHNSGGHPRIELGTLRCNPLMAGIG